MHNIEKLTKLNVELEGLLYVLAKRDSDELRELVKDKFNQYNYEFNQLLTSFNDAHTKKEEHAAEEEINDLTYVEIKSQEAVEGEVEDEIDASVEAIEKENSLTINESTPVNNETVIEDNEHNDNEKGETEGELISKPEEEKKYIPHLEADETPTPDLSVDEMLSRKEAADLKRVFTLNDKFRFRRALFNQNDTEFSNALTNLSEIPTFAKATEYLIATYGWSTEDPDFEDFLAIIKPHYPC